MPGTAPHSLDPAPDLAVRIALRDRALRTLSELMAAEHSPGDRRQAATAALRYLALFEDPRGNKSPSPPTSPPDSSPPSRPASNATPAPLRFEPPPALAKIISPRAAASPGPIPLRRPAEVPDQARGEFAQPPRRGDALPADLAQRSGPRPIAVPGQSPPSPLSDPTSRGDSDNHNHDYARAPPARFAIQSTRGPWSSTGDCFVFRP